MLSIIVLYPSYGQHHLHSADSADAILEVSKSTYTRIHNHDVPHVNFGDVRRYWAKLGNSDNCLEYLVNDVVQENAAM